MSENEHKRLVGARSRVLRVAVVTLPFVLFIACNGILSIGEPNDPSNGAGGRGGSAGTAGEHGGESGDGRGGSGGSATSGASGTRASGGSTNAGSGGGSGGEDAGNGGAAGEDAGSGGVGGSAAGSGGVGGTGAGGMSPIVIAATAVEDASIKDESPDLGFATTCEARSDSGPMGSGITCLLRWDLSSIPPGSSVEEVWLQVNVDNESPQPITAYPLRVSWSELFASWTDRLATTPWELPGAKGPLDRGSAVGNLFFDREGSVGVSLDDQWIALVQSWVDAPSTNHGVSLASAQNANGISISSKDEPYAAYRPRLVVTYLQPPGN